jgi:hypothetical protein
MTVSIDPTPGTGGKSTPSPRRLRRLQPVGARPGIGAGNANWAVRIVLTLVCVVWMIPVVGLLINSFRPRDIQFGSGWWSIFGNPLDATQWTLSNYDRVLSSTDPAGIDLGQAHVEVVRRGLGEGLRPEAVEVGGVGLRAAVREQFVAGEVGQHRCGPPEQWGDGRPQQWITNAVSGHGSS